MKTLLFSLNFLFLFSTFFSKGLNAEEVLNPFSLESTQSHEVKVLNHGLGSLEMRLEMIERAKESIDVEYFIYRVDKSAKIFTQALVKKAREGVKVRMLLDYYMIKKDLSPFYTHELEKEGIEIKYFNTVPLTRLLKAQYRNHRKVLLIDGKEAITGGRNIGDEYFDLHADYNFLDREIWVKGDLISAVQKTFDKTFNSKLSKRVSRRGPPKSTDLAYKREKTYDHAAYKRDLKKWYAEIALAKDFVNKPVDEKLYQEVREKGKVELEKEYEGTCSELGFHSEYPNLGRKNKKTNRVVKHDLFDRIESATESIIFDSPYFIVNKELSSAIETALRKKVDVSVLTNSLYSTDAIYVYAAFDTKVVKLLDKGLEAYILKGKRPDNYEVIEAQAGEARYGVHAKTFIFDKKDLVIGTYNLDPRSANYNSEMIFTCENNPELAKVVGDDIEVRKIKSIHLASREALKEAEFYQTDFLKRVTYYLLKLPSNLLSFLL